jgi:hypothetical protein
MSYPMKDYLPLTNVQVFANANWTGPLYTFPTGFINGGRNSITCKDETAPQRPATCVKGQQYFIRVQQGGHVEQWEGQCVYDAGGVAPLQFDELELAD